MTEHHQTSSQHAQYRANADGDAAHNIEQPSDALDTASKEHVQLNELDVDQRLNLEKEDNSRDASPVASVNSPASRTIVSFEHNDPENPYNWPSRKKIAIVLVAILTVLNSTIGSSLTAGATAELSAYFHITNESQLVLPTSIYLVGYVVGPLLFGPLSEFYGRKWIMIFAFFLYTVFTLACALAPNYPSLIVFRLLSGAGASCPIAVVGGICADVYNDPQSRGRAMAIFMAATTWGPCLGPVISGFISVITWRWSFWVGLIIAGATCIPIILMPESYGPVILQRRARRRRKETQNPNFFAPIELEEKNLHHVIVVVLTRPIRMFFFEAIVLFSCLYLSLAYAIFYIFLVSYPIIFRGIYGFNAGEEGLAFLPIGIGAIFACLTYLLYDNILRRARIRAAPWCRSEEMRRLPLACIAGPFIVLSLFWAGWTARPSIHWLVPVLAGIPFGVGYLLIFMALLNYLVDAYEVFAASTMAAASCSRSLFGAVLPFATAPMYARLGVPWACSLLGFLSLAMCVVPFVFIAFGERIRAKSTFCQYLARKKREEAEKGEVVGRDEEVGGAVRGGDQSNGVV